MHRFENWSTLKDLTFFQMKARYRGTAAGFLWVVLNPVILLLVQGVIFRHVLKVQMANYPAFLLGGLLPWTFFAMSLQMGVPALSNARQLLLAFRIDPTVFVLSVVLDNWINFAAAFGIAIFGITVMSDASALGWHLVLFPAAAILLLAGIYGLVMYLALFNVFFRDVRFICHFILNILLFATPVFYPVDLIPADWRWAVEYNPMTILIEPVRLSVMGFSEGVALPAFRNALLLSAGLLLLSMQYWKRRRNEFYLYL